MFSKRQELLLKTKQQDMKNKDLIEKHTWKSRHAGMQTYSFFFIKFINLPNPFRGFISEIPFIVHI